MCKQMHHLYVNQVSWPRERGQGGCEVVMRWGAAQAAEDGRRTEGGRSWARPDTRRLPPPTHHHHHHHHHHHRSHFQVMNPFVSFDQPLKSTGACRRAVAALRAVASAPASDRSRSPKSLRKEGVNLGLRLARITCTSPHVGAAPLPPHSA